MSTITQCLDLHEQICYVRCSFCTTILLVSVPSNSLSMVVTVRCGHCCGLLSVNMLKASFIPLHVFASSLNKQQVHYDQELLKQQQVLCSPAAPEEEMDAPRLIVDEKHDSCTSRASIPLVSDKDDDDGDEDDYVTALSERVANRPPEKKKRAPSAYNTFIKEEIKRLKAMNPNMSHKEAFSNAAKNWAHFPSRLQQGIDGCSNGKEKIATNSDNFELLRST